MGFAMDSLPSIHPRALLAVCRAVNAPLGWTAAGQSGSLGLEYLGGIRAVATFGGFLFWRSAA